MWINMMNTDTAIAALQVILENKAENQNATDAHAVKPILAEYLGEEDLADEIGLTSRTLRRWHVLRIGPPRTVIGRKVLYHVPSFRKWLQERQQADCRA